MQKITLTDNFSPLNIDTKNVINLNQKYQTSIKSMNSIKSTKYEYSMMDMINLLEIKTNTKKCYMLHH